MAQCSKKKKWLIGFIIIYLCVGVIVFLGHTLPHVLENDKETEYLKRFESEVLDYVRKNTDLQERYGDSCSLSIHKWSWSYEQEYLDSKPVFFFPYPKELNTFESFQTIIHKITFYVEVKNNVWQEDFCVVTLTKNELGELVIAGWYWEET